MALLIYRVPSTPLAEQDQALRRSICRTAGMTGRPAGCHQNCLGYRRRGGNSSLSLRNPMTLFGKGISRKRQALWHASAIEPPPIQREAPRPRFCQLLQLAFAQPFLNELRRIFVRTQEASPLFVLL